MGKAIIVPGVDWSNNNLGQVTALELSISGASSIDASGVFTAMFGGNAVGALWSLSDNTVASLSSNTGETVTVTVLRNGTVTLSATYLGYSATLTLTCSLGYITEADFTQEMCHYYKTSQGKTRTILLFDILDASTFHGTIQNNAINIDYALVLWDSGQVTPSSDNTDPSTGTPVSNHTVWDSSWKTDGETQSVDSTCNKDNSIGTANSSATPNRVGLVATYNTDGRTGMPTLAEIMQSVTFMYYAK